MKRKVKIVGLCTLVWISGAFYLLQNNKHEVSGGQYNGYHNNHTIKDTLVNIYDGVRLGKGK